MLLLSSLNGKHSYMSRLHMQYQTYTIFWCIQSSQFYLQTFNRVSCPSKLTQKKSPECFFFSPGHARIFG